MSIVQLYSIEIVNNITTSGTQVVGGITPSTGVLVMLGAQTTANQNGIWQVNTLGAWTAIQLIQGLTTQPIPNGTNFYILNGTYANNIFQISNNSLVNPVSRDLNGNALINNLQDGIVNNTGTGTINFTNASAKNQLFTGSGAVTAVLPHTTTISDGWSINFYNNTTTNLTVNNFAGTTLIIMPINSQVTITLQDFFGGTWDFAWSGTVGGIPGNIITPGNIIMIGAYKNIVDSGISTESVFGSSTNTTSGGTTVLTANSTLDQVFKGTSTQIVTLPNATTLSNGRKFVFINLSTGALTLNENGGTTLATINANTNAQYTLADNSTSNGTWAAI